MYPTDTNFHVLNTDNATVEFKTVSYANVKLATFIGGGYYNGNISVSSTDFTSSGTSYVCSNTTFQDAFIKSICYRRRELNQSGLYMYFIDGSNQNRDFYVTVQSNRSGDVETYTIDALESSSVVTYDYSTKEYTLSNITFTNALPDFMSGYRITAMQNDIPVSSDIIETVNPKFLPAFNVAPTAAGTYVLKATVDAQGNITYSWVAEV